MDIDTLTNESLLPKSQQKSRLDKDDAAANKKKDSEDEDEDEWWAFRKKYKSGLLSPLRSGKAIISCIFLNRELFFYYCLNIYYS